MKKLLLGILITSMILSVFGFSYAASTLKDVKGTKYETAVNELINLEIVNGYPDGTFLPDKPILRSEMAKLLVNAYGYEELANKYDKSTGFADVDAVGIHWARRYINLAKELGIISGYPDGTFKADNEVTYAEAITMAVRVLGYKEETEKTGTWPTNYINKAKNLKLTKDISVNSFEDNAKRGDIAILIWNMLNTKMNDEKETLLEYAFPNNDLSENEDDELIDDEEEYENDLTIGASKVIEYSKESNYILIVDAYGDEYKLEYTKSQNSKNPISKYEYGVIVYDATDELELLSGLTLKEIKELENSTEDHVIKEIDKDGNVLYYNNDKLICVGDAATKGQEKTYKDYLFVYVEIFADEKDENFVNMVDCETYDEVIEDEGFFAEDGVVIENKDEEIMYVISGYDFIEKFDKEEEDPEEDPEENPEEDPEEDPEENPEEDQDVSEDTEDPNDKRQEVKVVLKKESVTIPMSAIGRELPYKIDYTITPSNAKVKFEMKEINTEGPVHYESVNENGVISISYASLGSLKVAIILDSDGYKQSKGTVLATFTLILSKEDYKPAVGKKVIIPANDKTLADLGREDLGTYKISKFHDSVKISSDDEITGKLKYVSKFKEYDYPTDGYYLVLQFDETPVKVNYSKSDYECIDNVVVICIHSGAIKKNEFSLPAVSFDGTPPADPNNIYVRYDDDTEQVINISKLTLIPVS